MDDERKKCGCRQGGGRLFPYKTAFLLFAKGDIL